MKKIILTIVRIWIRIRWSPFNPWALAYMNKAWSLYKNTTMYEDRMKMDREFILQNPNYNGEFAFDAFISNGEFQFFMDKFTWKDKLKLWICPFSNERRFKSPFYLIIDKVFSTRKEE